MKKTNVCEICKARYRLNPSTLTMKRIYICMACESQITAIKSMVRASYLFMISRFNKKIEERRYQKELLEHTLEEYK